MAIIESFSPISKGTGSPEGKVAAPVGSIYTDTAATNGAVRWIKTSGTGTTGWSVEYGDTGWRVLPKPPEISEGSIHVRRINNQTIISLNVVGLPAIGTAPFLTVAGPGYIPAGFRPKNYGDRPTAVIQGIYAQYVGIVNVHQQSQIYYKSLPGKSDIGTGVAAGSGELAYVSEPTWPTTLPGTPA